MNTIKSTWIGWGTLCLAGGGAYYFAKRSINADRQQRYDDMLRRQQYQHSIESSAAHYSGNKDETAKSSTKKKRKDDSAGNNDFAGSPSREGDVEMAPTRHEPDTGSEEPVEKSKYEASKPYRSKKGDRFT